MLVLVVVVVLVEVLVVVVLVVVLVDVVVVVLVEVELAKTPIQLFPVHLNHALRVVLKYVSPIFGAAGADA